MNEYVYLSVKAKIAVNNHLTTRRRRLRAAQESMGSFYWQIAMAGKVVDIAYPEQKSNEEGDALEKSLEQSLRD